MIEKFSRDETVVRSDDAGARRVEFETTPSNGSVPPEDDRGDGDPGAVGDVVVEGGPDGVSLHLGTESTTLTGEEVRRLRSALGDALSERREFVHTAGRHREDGSYVVERRNADSAGHRKVFDSFRACRDLFEALPGSFTADDVERAGLTGGRRHVLVWHFVEHPAFECSLASRQPLTARKDGSGSGTPRSEVVGD